MSEVISDIANAMMMLRRAFIKHNLQPPARIVLSSWEDGQVLKQEARQDMTTYGMDPETGKPAYHVELVGMQVQIPTMRRAYRDGSFQDV